VRRAGPDLVQARSADGLGVEQGSLGFVEVAPQHVACPGDVQEHGGERVPGQIVQLTGHPSPLVGHRLVGQRPPGPLQLVDEATLALQGATQDEREPVGHDPGLPPDLLPGDRVAHDGHQPGNGGGSRGDAHRSRGRPEVPRHIEHHGHVEEEGPFDLARRRDHRRDRDEDQNREDLGGQARHQRPEDESSDRARHPHQLGSRPRVRPLAHHDDGESAADEPSQLRSPSS